MNINYSVIKDMLEHDNWFCRSVEKMKQKDWLWVQSVLNQMNSLDEKEMNRVILLNLDDSYNRKQRARATELLLIYIQRHTTLS